MSISETIATYLATNGLGTLGTNVFASMVPSGVNDGLVVIDSGGPAPDRYIPTKNPTFQVMIRASDYEAGITKLALVRSALHQLKNTTIGGYYFYYIMASSEGGHTGRDESGHDLFSINFETLLR